MIWIALTLMILPPWIPAWMRLQKMRMLVWRMSRRLMAQMRCWRRELVLQPLVLERQLLWPPTMTRMMRVTPIWIPFSERTRL